MQRYRVIPGAPLRLNLGDVVELSAAQLAGRSHKVEVKKKVKDSFIVHVNEMIEFKAGEEIGLPDTLPRRISDQLESLSGDAKLPLGGTSGPAPAPPSGAKA